MIKVIPSGSQDFGMPAARLVDVHSRGIDSSWMQKRAAVLTREIDEIRPEPGHSFLHVISLGAWDRYGQNRNADLWMAKRGEYTFPHPQKGIPALYKVANGLEELHKTFMTHGHVFAHHKNSDPKFAIGEIKAAAYNPDMLRGELILRVENDHPSWKSDLEKLANGHDISVSMAFREPHDHCNYCGHKAKNRGEYCECLRNHMSEITKEGDQIGAINDDGVFFDISKVFRPADRIAWSLQKVAELTNVGGAELAEQLGLSADPVTLRQGGPVNFARKMAAVKKLAAIEKLIEGLAKGEDNKHLANTACGCPGSSLPDTAVRTLQGGDLESVLRSLGDAKISLSVDDFMRLVMGSEKSSGPIPCSADEVKGALPGVFNRLLDSGEAEQCASSMDYDGEAHSIPRGIRELLENLMADHSLAQEPAHRRIRLTIIRGRVPNLAGVKEASLHSQRPAVSKSAELLAKEYATYQIAFAAAADDDFVNSLAVLRNYL